MDSVTRLIKTLIMKKFTNVISLFKGTQAAVIGAFVLALAAVFMYTSTAFALNTVSATMRVGSRGSDVTTLQSFLSMDGSVYPEGLVTGYFGTRTKAAVIRFQERYSLGADGIVGPITRQKINELILNGGFPGVPGTNTSGAPMIMGVANSNSVNSNATSSRATISWQTNEASRGKVFYSSTPLAFTEVSDTTSEPFISGTAVVDGTFNTSKSLALDNLARNTTYYYMILAADANGNVSVTWPATFSTN